jgi:hypothetical protein
MNTSWAMAAAFAARTTMLGPSAAMNCVTVVTVLVVMVVVRVV